MLRRWREMTRSQADVLRANGIMIESPTRRGEVTETRRVT